MNLFLRKTLFTEEKQIEIRSKGRDQPTEQLVSSFKLRRLP